MQPNRFDERILSTFWRAQIYSSLCQSDLICSRPGNPCAAGRGECKCMISLVSRSSLPSITHCIGEITRERRSVSLTFTSTARSSSSGTLLSRKAGNSSIEPSRDRRMPSNTGRPDLDPKWVRLAPNGTISGIFSDQIQYILAHLWPI